MQMVKIRIPDNKDRGKALVEMARRGRVDCYADNVYVVPEPALELLNQLGIGFVELERGGIDYAEKMLRDTLTAHAQRRSADRPADVRADAG
jgi:hypothetical protein